MSIGIYQALRDLLLVTLPWCFFSAHPFLLLKSLIITKESSRPPTFSCGHLFVKARSQDPTAPKSALPCPESMNMLEQFKHMDLSFKPV